jgi:hypothetical protein
MNFNQHITDYIGKASADQIIALEKLRSLIHSTVPNVSEAIKWNMPVFNNGKDFAYMRFAKNHVTLGFYHIDKIQDPHHLLEGEGNTLKHIKIKHSTDIDPKIITQWLKQITT